MIRAPTAGISPRSETNDPLASLDETTPDKRRAHLVCEKDSRFHNHAVSTGQLSIVPKCSYVLLNIAETTTSLLALFVMNYLLSEVDKCLNYAWIHSCVHHSNLSLKYDLTVKSKVTRKLQNYARSMENSFSSRNIRISVIQRYYFLKSASIIARSDLNVVSV